VEDCGRMLTLLSVLDGPDHPGLVLDLDVTTSVWSLDGVTYQEVGGLHAHEQHECVRWFRVIDRS